LAEQVSQNHPCNSTRARNGPGDTERSAGDLVDGAIEAAERRGIIHLMERITNPELCGRVLQAASAAILFQVIDS
jgi:hypothetical protein